MNQLLQAMVASFLLSFSTNSTVPPSDPASHDFHFAYSMEEPILKYELPIELEEISGLSLSPSPNHLVANNDELGIIYYLNKSTGQPEKEVPFHKEGDYEGIEMVGEKVFVVKSSGTIYEFDPNLEESQRLQKHKFFLSKENDVEALGLDSKNNRLLLACKGKAGDGERFTRTKAVFAFNLDTRQLQKDPVFLITLEDVCNYLGHCTLESHILENLHDFFNPKGEILGFSPSSLAIHPITGHMYITSSKGKMILVLNEEGKILHIEKLKKSIHPQPEGICFEKDGTMWISNESKKEAPGMLYQFSFNE